MLILAIALIIIGPEEMPVVVRTMARLMRELRVATNEAMRELTEALEEEEPPKPRPKLPPPEPRKSVQHPPDQSPP